jgi:menaquinone-dependent protoporphyrinogen oxidase
MVRFLVVYGTTEGHTRKVAERAAEVLQRLGHQTVVQDSTKRVRPLRPDEADAVILAASVHAGRYQAALVHFVRASLPVLDTVPNAFLSVSLAAAGLDPVITAETGSYVEHLVESTGWRPQRVLHVAGALRFTRYDFLKRLVMRLVSGSHHGPTDTSRDHEFTDWGELERFLTQFAASGSGAPRVGSRN